jgi:DNA-binding MarR family transcriptional regulator
MKSEKTAELSILIANAGRLLHQRMHHNTSGSHLSMLHFKILGFVENRGQASMKDIANFLGITPPSATVLVNRLVKARELARVTQAGDRRLVKIGITATGQRSFNAGKKLMVERMKSVLGKLAAAEIKQLTSILKHLLEI